MPNRDIESKYLFQDACLIGDLDKVKGLIEGGASFHKTSPEILRYSIEDSQFHVAEFLIRQGANILQSCLPDFFHALIIDFLESCDYGHEPISQEYLEQNDFSKIALFMQRFGYPINMPINETHEFGRVDIGKNHIGETELDLAINFRYESAVVYLRKNGGKRKNEICSLAGNFVFLNNFEDNLVLDFLISYELGKEGSELNGLKEILKAGYSLNKLIVIALLNNYVNIINFLKKEIPLQMGSYLDYFQAPQN